MCAQLAVVQTRAAVGRRANQAPARLSPPHVPPVIAFLLLGIEEIGVAIEEPFSILPLGAFCDVAGEVWRGSTAGLRPACAHAYPHPLPTTLPCPLCAEANVRELERMAAGDASNGNGAARATPARELVEALDDALPPASS